MTRRPEDEPGNADTVGSGDTHEPRTHSGETFVTLPDLDRARYRTDDSPDAFLGKGGQGAVWRGRDEVLRRDVALKALHRRHADDPDAVAAFLREARLTASLEHPGIVPLHDVGRDADGLPTLVLRRIEGRSLADTLGEAKSLEARLPLVPALLRAAQAVAFAHQHGVVHRDLKPQNIMLGSFGETYVLDWGLAIVTGGGKKKPDVTAPPEQGVAGTPAYMSPEQAMGLPVDARSDVWGLGACLYQVLTGEPPLRGRTAQSAVGHAAAGEVAPLRALEPTVPDDLAAICEKALQPRPADRYATAVELATDLEAWLAGRTVSARTYTRVDLVTRLVQANRPVVLAVFLALVALAVALLVDEFRVRRERNDARTFARELLRSLPGEVDTRKPNIALVAMLTARLEEWLARNDLSAEEQAEACQVLVRLAYFNVDTHSFEEAVRLSQRAVERGRRGIESSPGEAGFVVCTGDGLAALGFAASEQGHTGEASAWFRQAAVALEQWKGPPEPRVLFVKSSLLSMWSTNEWTVHPHEASARAIESSTIAASVLEMRPSEDIANGVLNYGANGANALWAAGRRAEARTLTERFLTASALACTRNNSNAQHGCVAAMTSAAVFRAWDEDPRTDELLSAALAREASLLERDSDSYSVLYDAMVFALERGDYAVAMDRCATLRANGQAEWVASLGPFAAVMRGDVRAAREWVVEGSVTPVAHLALGLAAAAEGRRAEAAKEVRAAKDPSLWFELSWTPHPHPALTLSAELQPAFERFLTDFTAEYRKGSSGALDEVLETFALALERP